MEITGKISGKSIQEGETNGKFWKRCVFVVNELKYSTFDTKIIEGFNIGDNVKIIYEQQGNFKNLKSMEKAQGDFKTANQVDTSIWEKKDLRQARMSGLKAATAILDIMSRIEPEKLKEEITKSTSYVLLAEDMATRFIDWIYSEDEENPFTE